MRVGLLRKVGVATAAYGVAVAAWPGLPARLSGLTDEGGRTAAATGISLRPPGWRDAAGGAAPAPAPKGRRSGPPSPSGSRPTSGTRHCSD
ncbi:hypothetical protein ACIHCQ_27690 [Streptomyces sp. NPDC052236]|uniref:hypothetical protein n=1 Tax=Streptomyces sp. NPDC052236 TaxID=3365686 RepID=UPI0037D47F94